MFLIYVLLVSTCPKLHPVSLYENPFLRYRPFWDKHTEWHENGIEFYKVKRTHIWVTNIHKSQISLPFALWPAVFEIRPFWDCTKWPQITLNITRSKLLRICVTSIPESPKFSPLCSMTIRFQDIAHFIINHWITIVVKRPKQRIKLQKKKKINMLNFTILLTTLV